MTDRMTEEKAREYLDTSDPISKMGPEWYLARGYLQGLKDERAKAKGLVEAAESFEKLKGKQIAYEGGHVVAETVREIDSMIANLLRSLARYKEAK